MFNLNKERKTKKFIHFNLTIFSLFEYFIIIQQNKKNFIRKYAKI